MLFDSDLEFNINDFLLSEPVLIAKSNIILDVKPWDDETNMAELEKCVRSIEMDGLLWGACKYGAFINTLINKYSLTLNMFLISYSVPDGRYFYKHCDDHTIH